MKAYVFRHLALMAAAVFSINVNAVDVAIFKDDSRFDAYANPPHKQFDMWLSYQWLDYARDRLDPWNSFTYYREQNVDEGWITGGPIFTVDPTDEDFVRLCDEESRTRWDEIYAERILHEMHTQTYANPQGTVQWTRASGWRGSFGYMPSAAGPTGATGPIKFSYSYYVPPSISTSGGTYYGATSVMLNWTANSVLSEGHISRPATAPAHSNATRIKVVEWLPDDNWTP